MLKGDAKRLYQREYMRRRRSNVFVVLDPVSAVRPVLDPEATPLLDPVVRPNELLVPATSGEMLDPVRPGTGSVRPVLDPAAKPVLDLSPHPFTPAPKPGKR